MFSLSYKSFVNIDQLPVDPASSPFKQVSA